jgi:hypothetical protein
MFIRCPLLIGRITPARNPVLAVTDKMGTRRQESATHRFDTLQLFCVT